MHGHTLNLSDDLTTCKEIILNNAASTIIIRSDGVRNGVPVKIFTNGNINQTKLEGSSNFIFYTTNNDKTFAVSNWSNFTIHSTNEVTVNNTNSGSHPLYHGRH